MTQFERIIDLIGRSGPCTATFIAGWSGCAVATAWRILREAEGLGLVCRVGKVTKPTRGRPEILWDLT